MLLAAFEATLNRNIAASSAARNLCARLNGKSLGIQLTGVPLRFTLRVDAEQVRLTSSSSSDNQTTDALLTGTPLGLLSLAAKQAGAAVQGSSVHIAGDAEVAQAFSELLKQAKPDFEEELSRVVGDVMAHQLGNTARSIVSFGKRVGDTLLQNVGEYLQEEGRDVPNKTEAEEFTRDVDILRDDVARFAARLALLERNGNSK